MRIIQWKPDRFPGLLAEGDEGPHVMAVHNLTELHGEREFARHVVSHAKDGTPTLVGRTMNGNQLRAIDAMTGKTVWLSENIRPFPESNQISQLGYGDMDGDGNPEAFIASYQGDCILIDTRDGSTRWHKRLPWHINNPLLDIRKALPGPGGQVAMVVGNDFDWCGPQERRRINMMRKPTLILLNGEGEVVLEVPEYSENNGNAHNVWMHDIDGDGLCEIFCCGFNEVLAFRSDGTKLFSLPCKGDESGKGHPHPDGLVAANWDPTLPGLEVIYLNDDLGIIVASSSGEVLRQQTYPRDIASHLQNLTICEHGDDLHWIGQNIRSRDSMFLYGNRALEIEWAARMEGDMGAGGAVFLLDWDGDGEPEIVCGSMGKILHNEGGVAACSLQVMKLDGTPLYWHRWEGDTLCVPMTVADLDGDGQQEVVVGVGKPGGTEGRWSLAEGDAMRLYVMKP